MTESIHGVREESPPKEGELDSLSETLRERLRIFFPFAHAQRTTQWERGDEPMTQFFFTEDYDDFGQSQRQTQIACPRGWRSPSNTLAEPCLATRSYTVYAEPLNSQIYIQDRVARTTIYEIRNTNGKTVEAIATLADNSSDLKIIGQTLNFYDGQGFQGLPYRQVEKYGALVRSLTLAMTEENLQDAYGGNRPPYLSNPVNWTDDYPQEFQNQLPVLVGYDFQTGEAGSPFARGYFVIAERRKYDFQETDVESRGLVKVMLDPLGRDTTIEYDNEDDELNRRPYRLLPTKVKDAVGLETKAEYDYRVLQPKVVTDANGNQTEFRFTPLGLLKETWVKGKSATEGDRDRPSIRMEYGFRAFETSPVENRQPIFVKSTRYTHHDTETNVDLEETITTVEFSDGFGRLLQTRTQAEEVLFGNPVFGGEILPLDQTDEEGARQPVVGQRNNDPDNPNVVVSGWQIYDNKGRVVEKYEPFYSTGWAFLAPLDEQKGQKVRMFYDPRGQVICTLNPDGSEQRVIYGIPQVLTKSNQFQPTPWEAYTYDANDLAPLCFSLTETLADGSPKPLSDRAPESHHYTPASIEIDALGRTIKAVERNGSAPGDWYITQTTYDIRGNVLTIKDALNREAFKHVYDLANRKLWIYSIDAGNRWMVLDAIANPVEQWDRKGLDDSPEQQNRKGALTLHAYDRLNRPTHLWARDGAGQDLTLREKLVYGDGGKPDQPDAEREANRQVNRLGKLYQHFDEAGMQQFEGYDFKGNLREKVRKVIRDDQILRVFDNAPANNWQVKAYRVDWQNSTDTLLDATPYTTSIEYDALNRVKVMRYPQTVDGSRKELVPHYNRAGALEAVTLGGKPYVERIAYNAKGQRVLIAYGNGVVTRHAYDPQTFRLGRMRSQQYDHPPDDPLTYRFQGAPLQDFGYEYDLVGNITKIRDRTPESGISGQPDRLDRIFEYEPIYRLILATGRECNLPPESPPWADEPRCTDLTSTRAYTEHYRYDPVGNMLQLRHEHFDSNGSVQGRNRDFKLITNDALEPVNNRLATVTVGQTDYQYTYDNNGNLIQENGARHFEWDYGDRLRVFRTQTGNAEPSVHAHYLYDASGQRVKKLVRKGNRVEVTVYIDGVFEYQRIVQSGEPQENNTLHVMDNQSRIALVRVGNPFPNDTTPTVKYHLGDHLGSSNVVVDEAGNLVNREEYTPYGETSFGSFARKRYRLTGKERDEESGLNYHGARYYASWLVRWTSCDPAGTVDGINLYAYVAGNPIRLKDFSGLQGSAGDIPPASPATSEATGTSSHAQSTAGGTESKSEQLSTASPSKSPGLEYEHRLSDRQTDSPIPSAPSSSKVPWLSKEQYDEAFKSMGGPKQDKKTVDKVAETVQSIIATSLVMSTPTGQLDIATGGAISSLQRRAMKAVGFSEADMTSFSLFMAMEGQGVAQALSEGGQGLSAWYGSGLAKKQILNAVKAPAFAASGAGSVGGFSALESTPPNFKGEVGEARSVVEIEEQGGVIIGQHVSFRGATGQRATIDLVWVDILGVLRGTEVKFGEFARLTKPQTIVFPQGGHLLLTPVGSRAAEAGLTPGTPVGIHIDIARWLF